MKLGPAPTASELRMSRIYCAICAVAFVAPTAIAVQLRGADSWQAIACVVVALGFVLLAFALPASVRIFLVRLLPWVGAG
jgi:hypothetical protein